MRKDLKLTLTPEAGGFAYTWRDRRGRVVATGWSLGARRDGREEAMHALERLEARAAEREKP